MNKPATAETSTALVVAKSSAAAVYNLDAFPESAYNRLIPTQTIRIPSDMLVPVVQVVQLDPADRDGKSADHYRSNDVPAGHRAPTARGLNKLSTAAGVSFYDERRMDDGSDPDVMGVTVMASMMLPTGQRITAPGSQMISLRSWFGASTSDAEKAKFRKQFYGHVSTRARNRAIRGLLSLRSAYPDRDIAKPFAVVSYAPNLDHPAVRERMLDSIAPRAIAAVYGPETNRLGAGEPVVALPEIDEDDAVTASPRSPNGEPSWFGAASDDVQADVVALLEQVLRDSAEASGMKGAATEPQKAALQEILRPLGFDVVTAGFAAAFGVDLDAVTAAQAQAVINSAGAYDDFAARWHAMVAGKRAA